MKKYLSIQNWFFGINQNYLNKFIILDNAGNLGDRQNLQRSSQKIVGQLNLEVKFWKNEEVGLYTMLS